MQTQVKLRNIIKLSGYWLYARAVMCKRVGGSCTPQNWGPKKLGTEAIWSSRVVVKDA